MHQQHFMPNRLSMMCSRRNCSYWRHCEQEWGGGSGDMKPQRNARYLAWIRTQDPLRMRV